MDDVTTLLRQKRSRFDQKLGEARAIKRRQGELEKEVEALGLEVSNYDKALAIFHGLSSVVQEHFTQAGTETNILDARGGGLSALCGVLLRIVILRLMTDRIRQILILDEPLSHLSAAYVPAAGELLRRLSDELDIQIIMVTHQPEFADHATDVYELSSAGSNVKVSRL
jgi:ABC-type cobalamin/Fe3+-siderophores transport system ATPase subunit